MEAEQTAGWVGWVVAVANFHFGQAQLDCFKPLVIGVWRSEERSGLKYEFGGT